MDDDVYAKIREVRADELFDGFDGLVKLIGKDRSRKAAEGDRIEIKKRNREDILICYESPIKYKMMQARKIKVIELTSMHLDRVEKIKEEKLRLEVTFKKLSGPFTKAYHRFKQVLERRLDILFGCVRLCLSKILYKSSNIVDFRKKKDAYQLSITKFSFDPYELESSLFTASHVFAVFGMLFGPQEIQTENMLMLEERLSNREVLRSLITKEHGRLNETRFLEMVDFTICKAFTWYKYFKFMSFYLKVKERHHSFLELFFKRPEGFRDLFDQKEKEIEFSSINSVTKETVCGFEIIPGMYDEFEFIDYD